MSQEAPTPSFSITVEKESRKTINDDSLELYIENDKAEIELLESTSIHRKTLECDGKSEITQDDERIAKIKFCCYSCGMEEMVHYFGVEPDFVFGIKFNEPTYVMRDPFQPPPPRWKQKPEYFVAFGAHCKLCDSVVCKDNACSFFFINSFCLICAKKEADSFPPDVQQKLRKQLATI